MSKKELDRAEVVALVCQKRMTQRVAAEQLGISERQLRRIQKAYEQDGAPGLCSKRRGRPSNRRLSPELRHGALSLVRERYHDFGPTLACEKLKKLHGLSVSVESLRLLMIDEGLWVNPRLGVFPDFSLSRGSRRSVPSRNTGRAPDSRRLSS